MELLPIFCQSKKGEIQDDLEGEAHEWGFNFPMDWMKIDEHFYFSP